MQASPLNLTHSVNQFLSDLVWDFLCEQNREVKTVGAWVSVTVNNISHPSLDLPKQADDLVQYLHKRMRETTKRSAPC